MSLDSLHQLPPQNLDAEQSVLGAVLVDPEGMPRIVDILRPEDFYKAAHRRIYAEMLRLHDQRQPIDLVTLPEALRGSSALEEVGGASYIAYLVTLVPTGASIKSHAQIVREKSLFRSTIDAATSIVTRARDEAKKQTAEDLLDFAEQSILAVGQGVSSGGLVSASRSVGDSFRIIEERFERKQSITGVPTGYVDLDEKLSGLQPSDLILVAARPSMGKTAFALNVVANAGLASSPDEKDFPFRNIAVFSMEMSRDQLLIRMIGAEARVDTHRLMKGQIHEHEWPRIAHTAGRIGNSKIAIDDTGGLSVLEIRSRCRRMKAETGLDLVVIDYLQLMRGRGDEGNREQEISGVSRGLKALAKELNVPVVALSQLNRAVETRSRDKRPGLSDLRESGALEQDADVILFLYRDEVYTPCQCPPEPALCLCGRRHAAEVIIGKQRNGPIGKVELVFFNHLTRFENKEGRRPDDLR